MNSFKTFVLSKINNLRTYLGLSHPLVSLRFGLCLLFGLIPFRLFGILQFNLATRFVIGLLFVLLTFFKSNVLIPKILNLKLIQAFFFFSLVIDERFKCLHPFLRLPIFLGLVSLIVYTLLLIDGMAPICLALIFWFSFYKSLKVNFIDPKNSLSFISFRLDSSRDYFTCLDILENMNVITFYVFGKNVLNQLSKRKSEVQFTCAIRRILPTYVDG